MHVSLITWLRQHIQPYGPDIANDTMEQIQHQLVTGTPLQQWEYPWRNLETELGTTRLPLLAYGSLMNPASAARTLRNYSELDPTPVLVFGGQRIYHYRIPEATLARYPKPTSSQAIAALNVIASKYFQHFFNAILLHIPVSDLPELRVRERNYDLVQLPFLPWNSPNQGVRVAYALSSPLGSRGEVDNTLSPHEAYHRVCWEGALTFGAGFGQFFLDTSLLASGIPVGSIAGQTPLTSSPE